MSYNIIYIYIYTHKICILVGTQYIKLCTILKISRCVCKNSSYSGKSYLPDQLFISSVEEHESVNTQNFCLTKIITS